MMTERIRDGKEIPEREGTEMKIREVHRKREINFYPVRFYS